MNKSSIGSLSTESFSCLIALKNYYNQMIESLKVMMLDGLKNIPNESLRQRDEYLERTKFIDAAIDLKMGSFDRAYNPTVAN